MDERKCVTYISMFQYILISNKAVVLNFLNLELPHLFGTMQTGFEM
jgi:hypothetical protein